jgi:hypothetical protein
MQCSTISRAAKSPGGKALPHRQAVLRKDQLIISFYGDSCANAFCACELPFYVFFFSFRLA